MQSSVTVSCAGHTVGFGFTGESRCCGVGMGDWSEVLVVELIVHAAHVERGEGQVEILLEITLSLLHTVAIILAAGEQEGIERPSIEVRLLSPRVIVSRANHHRLHTIAEQCSVLVLVCFSTRAHSENN